MYELQQTDLDNELTLTRWGPWCNRFDEIEITDVWKRAEEVAVKRGVLATAYEQRHGAYVLV